MSEGVRVVRVSRGESQSGSVTMATCAVRLATTFLSRPQQESEKAFFFFFPLSTVELFLQGGESIKTPEERLIIEFQAS